MNRVAVHGWNIPSMDGRPIGGKIAAMRCMVETMGVPSIYGKPYRPWMEGDNHGWEDP